MPPAPSTKPRGMKPAGACAEVVRTLASRCKTTRFSLRVLGLEQPWEAKDLKRDLLSHVAVILECRGYHSWPDGQGGRMQVHSWEEGQWRRLDTTHLETVLVARVPRLLDPRSGR